MAKLILLKPNEKSKKSYNIKREWYKNLLKTSLIVNLLQFLYLIKVLTT